MGIFDLRGSLLDPAADRGVAGGIGTRGVSFQPYDVSSFGIRALLFEHAAAEAVGLGDGEYDDLLRDRLCRVRSGVCGRGDVEAGEKMEIMSKNRIGWIDSCKGLAIILVVVGHILDSYFRSELFLEQSSFMLYSHSFIYSFHMPLFFCLSGFVFYQAYLKNSECGFRKIWFKDVNNIYIYILWSFIQWAAKVLFTSDVNEKLTVKDLMLIPIKPMSPYWYIYVMIFYYVIFYFYEKLTIGENYKLIIMIALSMIGSCIDFDIIFPLGALLKFISFFYFGIYISKLSDPELKLKKTFVFYAPCSLASIICIFMFNVNLLDIKVIGIIAAMCLSLLIIYLFVGISFINRSKILNLCGQYSLEIYVTHCFIIAANRNLLLKFGLTNFYANAVINFIMATFIPVLCAYLLKKIGIHRAIFRPTSYFYKRELEK